MAELCKIFTGSSLCREQEIVQMSIKWHTESTRHYAHHGCMLRSLMRWHLQTCTDKLLQQQLLTGDDSSALQHQCLWHYMDSWQSDQNKQQSKVGGPT